MELEPEVPLVEVEAEVENLGDDVDEIAESLAVHSIISEERHAEILGEIETCKTQLEHLSTIQQQQTGAENPVLSQLMAEVGRISAQLESLKSSLDLSISSRRQSESNPPPPEVEVTVEVPEESAEDHENKIAPKRSRRFNLL